jgi:ABC-type branched-subunit amino acid transport system substrate-binding protein
VSHASVFLSYSQEDKPWAEAFAKALRRRGLSLWLDEGDLKAGEDSVDEAVDAALRQSETVVLLLGPGSVERPSLFFELGAALAMRKRIIPILSEGMERSKIPVPLLHGRYLMKKNPQETAQEVAQAVAA